MSTLSYDAILNGLLAQGVPRWRAELRARELTTYTEPNAQPAPAATPAPTWPVRLRLPWSMLVSDNDKYTVSDNRMILTTRYRKAKGRIQALARLGASSPANQPVRLVAAVYVPDNRAHDVCNFAKLVHDALQGLVYTTDRWLYDARWYRAGVDVDAPRAEITITPTEGR